MIEDPFTFFHIFTPSVAPSANGDCPFSVYERAGVIPVALGSSKAFVEMLVFQQTALEMFWLSQDRCSDGE